MLNLLNGIQTAFNTASNVPNSPLSIFAKKLEHSQAADAALLPNCLMVEVSNVTDYSTLGKDGFRTITETICIQFTIRCVEMAQVRQAMRAIQDTFDHKSFPVAFDRLVDSRKLSGLDRVIKDSEHVWRGDVEYQFTISRNLN
jgi:hypothetical protein